MQLKKCISVPEKFKIKTTYRKGSIKYEVREYKTKWRKKRCTFYPGDHIHQANRGNGSDLK